MVTQTAYHKVKPNHSTHDLNNMTHQGGLTLIELMITIVIIGILGAIAYPSYQNHTIEVRRTEAMTKMFDIAKDIQTQKLQKGSYDQVAVNPVDFPTTDPIYRITVTPTPISANWIIKATPIPTAINKDDGTLTLNSTGLKCRASLCGVNDEWKDND